MLSTPRAASSPSRDNGNGLTEEEIGTYLSTIGRGYTRELRERLALCSPAEAAELIGQFGLGFLSAFLLASEVTLTTRSVQGGPALRWHSAGDEHYDLAPASATRSAPPSSSRSSRPRRSSSTSRR